MDSESYVSEANPIVVGGCGRSGTTLLRVILDSHPHICCGPESFLLIPGTLSDWMVPGLAWRFDMPQEKVQEFMARRRSQAHFADMFFRAYVAQTGKRRWAEKTPRNVSALADIFLHFPKAQFIHMIRDGRDTVCSIRTHPRFKVENGALAHLPTCNPWEMCVERWVRDVKQGLAFRGDPRYVEVRYENLVQRTEATLRELLAFLGEPWDDRVLEYYRSTNPSRDVLKFPRNPEATRPIFNSALGKWRKDLTAEGAALFKKEAGALLIQLGYAADNSWEPNGPPAQQGTEPRAMGGAAEGPASP